jgi:hypothetical protein
VDTRGAPGLAEDPAGHTELLAEQAGIAIPHILQARRDTQVAFATTMQALENEAIPDSVSVCVFGSWARRELTAGSDHDWAILTAQPIPEQDSEISAVMRAAKRHLGGEDHAPGPQQIFGVPFDVHTLVHNVGLDGDTNQNLTRRMLLLLESAALTGSTHAFGREAVLDRYMNDGAKDFWPPRFLLNDLIRYWRRNVGCVIEDSGVSFGDGGEETLLNVAVTFVSAFIVTWHASSPLAVSRSA